MTLRPLVLFAAIAVSCAAYATQPDPIYRETIIRHARPRIAGEKFDPQENDPKLRAAFATADAAAERRVAAVKRDDKFALRFWSAKKQILQQKFGIDWKSPAELNPTLAYESYGQPKLTEREIHDITPIIRKRTSKRIMSFDREMDGTIKVWTKPSARAESTVYVIRSYKGSWKIVDVETWLP